MPPRSVPPPEDVPTGQRMLYWLSQACRSARAEAGQPQEAVTVKSPRHTKDVVKRFESAQNWPQRVGELVAAYAEISDRLDDGRELWQQALNLWYEHGSQPLIGRREEDGLKPSQRVAAEVERTAERQAQKRAARESEQKTTSSRKRRAAR